MKISYSIILMLIILCTLWIQCCIVLWLFVISLHVICLFIYDNIFSEVLVKDCVNCHLIWLYNLSRCFFFLFLSYWLHRQVPVKWNLTVTPTVLGNLIDKFIVLNGKFITRLRITVELQYLDLWYLEYSGYDKVICKSQPFFFRYFTLDTSSSWISWSF